MIGPAGFCIKEELVLKVTTAGSLGGRKNRFVILLLKSLVILLVTRLLFQLFCWFHPTWYCDYACSQFLENQHASY